MKHVTNTNARRLLLLSGVCLLVSLTGTGRADSKNGRDFAGFYHITDVTDAGDSYTLTFKARVMNYSGNAITDGTLVLRSSGLPEKDYAVFSSVTVADHQHATVSGSASVPKPEYDRWQRGATPVLVFQYKNANGDTREKRVELARRPIE